jgi:asparagine synthase (glutamine-hydrolysing)
MCGIFGILAHGGGAAPDRARLDRTACLLDHRGPDHHAVFADDRVGLVHTRLALVDLEARSNQPFWSGDGRFCLVFNGEIYNFRELRTELEGEGVSFRTTSDTEVLLETIIHRGLDATLPRLEGMFAFGLYDSTESTLTLARDRFGIKPLYVHDQDDAFLFASEIRAFRPWIEFEADPIVISSYLQGSGGPTSGRSFYRNISIVPPGTAIVVRPGRRGCYRQFWRMHDFWDPGEVERLRALKPGQIVDAVEEHLVESVRIQLLADVPVGVLCSGGLDSSLITAMAARVHNNVAIFHANVVGPESELDAATALARHLKLDLETVDVHDQDSIDSIPDVMLHYGHPFTYHPNSVPFLMVSKLVRDNRIKAILSGEGADESFIGYPWLIFNVREFLLGSSTSLRAVSRLLRRPFGQGFDDQRAVADVEAAVVRGLHNGFEGGIEADEIRTVLKRRNGRTPTDHELVTLNQLGYHLRTLLHRNDCLGMAASIETRFPFLDSRLVRLAVNMPYEAKVRFSPATLVSDHFFLRDKWVLRKVADRYLPRVLARRKKRGFAIQGHQRIRIKPELFRDSLVSHLFALGKSDIEFLIRHAGQALQLKLLHLDVWARVCVDGTPPADVQAHLQNCLVLA